MRDQTSQITAPREHDVTAGGRARGERVPRKVVVSAYAVPILVATAFSFVAAVPVLVLLISTLRSVRDRMLRWLAVLLSAVYAVPWAIWALRPDPADSLSKDMSPLLTVAIVAIGVVFVVAVHVVPRRSRRAG